MNIFLACSLGGTCSVLCWHRGVSRRFMVFSQFIIIYDIICAIILQSILYSNKDKDQWNGDS